jgi:predicted transcriptional regulator
MMTTTIRVSVQTRAVLHELAESSGASMQQVLDRALELYRRQKLLMDANLAYARLQEEADAWEEFQQEIQAWDATLADGLPEA